MASVCLWEWLGEGGPRKGLPEGDRLGSCRVGLLSLVQGLGKLPVPVTTG